MRLKITIMLRISEHLTILALLSSSIVLSGCIGYSPDDRLIGSKRADIVQRLGAPSNEISVSNGVILIYARGPFGKHTYFVHMDQLDQMTRWEQVLIEKNFDQVIPGMSREEVISTIGESKINVALARSRGYVWHYRYFTPHCRWFQIEFDSENTVRSTFYGRPPECRAPRAN